ncbi:MAG: hypothetical protein WDM70_00705 [Nitrosomonadales bacterium]
MNRLTRVRAIAIALVITFAAAIPGAVWAQVAAPAPVAQTPAPPTPATETTALQAPAANVSSATIQETVDNPYGLDALWKGGDFIAKATLLILLIMSTGSWYIIVTQVL